MKFLLFLLIVLFIVLFCGCHKVMYDDIYCSIYEPVKDYGYLKENDKILYDAIKYNNVVYTRFCLSDDDFIKEDKNN